MIHDVLIHGWVWCFAYVLLLVAACAFCAGLEAREEVDPAIAPWEGGEVVSNPQYIEGETA